MSDGDYMAFMTMMVVMSKVIVTAKVIMLTMTR